MTHEYLNIECLLGRMEYGRQLYPIFGIWNVQCPKDKPEV